MPAPFTQTPAQANPLLLFQSAPARRTSAGADQAGAGLASTLFERTLSSQVSQRANARPQEAAAPRAQPARDAAQRAESARQANQATSSSQRPGEAQAARRDPVDAADTHEEAATRMSAAEDTRNERPAPQKDGQIHTASQGSASVESPPIPALLAALQQFINSRPDLGQAAEAEQPTSPIARFASKLSSLERDMAGQVDAASSPHKPSLTISADARQALPTSFAALLHEARVAKPMAQVTQTGDGLHAAIQAANAARVAEGGRTTLNEVTRPMLAIHRPVGGEGWDKALGQQVIMMVDNQQQEVELQLNPPHLGPIEVRLSLDKDAASVSFVSQHAPVRDALQASLPKLGEMLSETGLQLAQANIFAGTPQQGQGEQPERGRRAAPEASPEEAEAVATAPARMRVWTGGLPGEVNVFI